ncbi:MAG: hypothetical protein GWP67_11375 [Gammaproteobacteria bacterium]|jgi:probable DNA repair protein|nr:hypothetical protein [Gammaproteobacteria bacterium]
MYDWLLDSLANDGTVVTANRRLARVLRESFSVAQVRAGRRAWRSPEVLTWQDWMLSLSNKALEQKVLPARINAHQSQILWERCLQKEVPESGSGISSLVRMSRDTQQKLADWQVSIGEVARAAQSEDQKIFASVAGRYLSILDREGWVDDAGLANLVLQLLLDGKIRLSGPVTFAGFERQRPIVVAIMDALVAAGVAAEFAPVDDSIPYFALRSYESDTAEYRSAGAWAREQVEKSPDAHIAIIANGLDKNAEVIARQVREGATPGWQHGHHSLYDAVNVSYGKRLSEYPAISIALLLLRWLVDDLPSTDVGLLLRSPLLGSAAVAGRSRLELRLRQLPDRKWSPSMITAELRGKDDDEAVGQWLAQLAAFSKRRRELPKTASPAEWVLLVDEILQGCMWAAQESLASSDFQLINRWRELLNEFARLALVSSSMNAGAAIARLDMMAGEVVFQPEASNACIHLIGPLEAPGIRFDALWISGLTTAHWPSAGSPSPLVSRRLQEKHGMPDATPADTLFYANQMLTRLLAAGGDVVCSHALAVEDEEQTVSDLLTALSPDLQSSTSVPGWHAGSLSKRVALVIAEDRIPAVTAGEKISGGAGTIQRQLSDPFTAFAHGRMGARPIYPQAVGIPAMMRGNLIHDALYRLYVDLPSSETIRSWKGQELTDRIDASVTAAFTRHERNSDSVLQQLLVLEKARVSELLRQFVAIDGDRGEFQVAGVEGMFEFVAGHIRLPLRFDRVDTLSDKGIAILDYKTGSRKQLVNRNSEAQEIQLFVYACATDAPVSALALVNVDSREIVFDGVGVGYTDASEWPDLLQRIKGQIYTACEEMAGGDVRINIEQGLLTARPLNLMSRYTELLHDDG